MRKINFLMIALLGSALVSAVGCGKGGDNNGNDTGVTPVDDGPRDKRPQLVGTYPVRIDAILPSIGDLYTDLNLEEEGRNNFKASGSARITSLNNMDLDISSSLIVQKELEKWNGNDVVGYYFDVPTKVWTISAFEFELAGTAGYDGYDGIVYKTSDGEKFIALEVSNVSIGGGLTVHIESGVAPE